MENIYHTLETYNISFLHYVSSVSGARGAFHTRRIYVMRHHGRSASIAISSRIADFIVRCVGWHGMKSRIFMAMNSRTTIPHFHCLPGRFAWCLILATHISISNTTSDIETNSPIYIFQMYFEGRASFSAQGSLGDGRENINWMQSVFGCIWDSNDLLKLHSISNGGLARFRGNAAPLFLISHLCCYIPLRVSRFETRDEHTISIHTKKRDMHR